MAESMESFLTGLIILAVAAILLTVHYHRERRRAKWLAHAETHRLLEWLRHRH
jgi:hypothetical protein